MDRECWSDEQLVRGALGSEDGCFEEIYRRNRPAVFGFALRRLPSECEAADVTQEVFLQVHRGLASYRCDSTLLCWILGIARFHVLRSYRSRERSGRSKEAAEGLARWMPGGSEDDRVDARRVLERCLRLLDGSGGGASAQKRVFELHYEQNLSTRQIAAELGKSRQAVKISLFRTRRMLENRCVGLNDLLN